MKTAKKITYWVATLWLSLGMISTGFVQLSRTKGTPGGPMAPGGVEAMAHLGYPAYLLTLLGVCKLLGVVAILIPKFPVVKEWAYAGFFFIMSGAVVSHLASGDNIGQIFPSALLLILIVVSWYCRPLSRKMVTVSQTAVAAAA